MIETLHCNTCDNDFTRERKRGVKPKICPACKAAAEAVVTEARVERATPSIDPEMVALFMASTKQSERVVAAFVLDGSEPPHRDKTDMLGFTFQQSQILDKLSNDHFDSDQWDVVTG